MARKNALKKTAYSNIYELEMSNGAIHYIANFSHNRKRYSDKNLTKMYTVQSAKQAAKKLLQIRAELDNKIDVFGNTSEKIDFLVEEYLRDKSPQYRKNSMATYNKHIKPVIGHLKIFKVTSNHLETIKTNMKNLGLSPNTMKKPKVILNPIFKKAFLNEVIRRNIVELVKFGEDIPKLSLTDRINEPLIDAIRKIYNAALNEPSDYSALFLTSIMCTRRLGEILEVNYEDIIDGVVHVRAETTKTFKKRHHPKAIVERYPLPKEVLDIIGTGTGKVFKHYKRTYMDKYAEMIDNRCNLDLKPTAKEYPIRSHENRSFIMSIQGKEFGRDLVGNACLSHRNRSSDINARYDSIEYEYVKKIYESYWGKLRANDFKELTKNAIQEAIEEVSNATVES